MTQPIENAAVDAPERKVDALLAHYSLSHTHPVNELIHYIAIPAIMLSLAGLMFAIHLPLFWYFLGPAWCTTPACLGLSRSACCLAPRCF